MEATFRYISGAIASLAAPFAPAVPLIVCAATFVGADFLTGVAASRARARRRGTPWWFESREAWRTVVKLGFVLAGIVLAWLADTCICGFGTSHLAKCFTGFTCGVEFWSFLENASQLSDAPVFRWLKRYVHRRIREEVDDEQ